jgi:hypothetical protein
MDSQSVKSVNVNQKDKESNSDRKNSDTNLNSDRKNSDTNLNSDRKNSDTNLNFDRKNSDTDLNSDRKNSDTNLNSDRKNSDTNLNSDRKNNQNDNTLNSSQNYSSSHQHHQHRQHQQQQRSLAVKRAQSTRNIRFHIDTIETKPTNNESNQLHRDRTSLSLNSNSFNNSFLSSYSTPVVKATKSKTMRGLQFNHNDIPEIRNEIHDYQTNRNKCRTKNSEEARKFFSELYQHNLLLKNNKSSMSRQPSASAIKPQKQYETAYLTALNAYLPPIQRKRTANKMKSHSKLDL